MNLMKKTIWILPVILLFTMLCVKDTEAVMTTEIILPAANAVLGSPYNIFVNTTLTASTEPNITNMTLKYQCSRGGALTTIITTGNDTLIVNNASTRINQLNYTWTTTGITDCNLTLSVWVYNSTGLAAADSETATNAGVVINNTNPTLSYTGNTPGDGSIIDLDETNIWSLSSTEELRSATLYIGTSSYGSFDVTNDAYTTWEINQHDDFTDVPPDANSYWYVSTVESDGSTHVTSNRTSDFTDGGGFVPPKKDKGNRYFIAFIVILVIGLIVAATKKN